MIYRGSVMEVYGDSIVVMTEECTFKRIKKSEGLEEGMEIYFEERDIIRKSNSNIKTIALVAASIFLFIVASFYGVDVWNTSYRAIALVSVDINPSVEIKVNKKHNIINAIALNEDAKKLPLKDLKNQPINKGLENLVNMARAEGYIKDAEGNYILVTSVELKEGVQEQELINLITEGKEKIENSAKEVGEQVEVITIKSNKETLEEAKKENISVGKKELNQNVNHKEIDNIKQRIKTDREQMNIQLKKMKEEAKQLEEKLRDIKKMNNEYNNKKYNENTKGEKHELKEKIKQEEDMLKEKVKQERNRIKEDLKQERDRIKENLKQEKDRLKKEEKENKNKYKEKTKKEKELKKDKKYNGQDKGKGNLNGQSGTRARESRRSTNK